MQKRLKGLYPPKTRPPGRRSIEPQQPLRSSWRHRAWLSGWAKRDTMALDVCCTLINFNIFSCSMEVDCDNGLTYKRARTAGERRRIEHEAAVLRRVAHPGIVQLVGTEGAGSPGALVLRTVNGGDLTSLGTQPMPVIAGLGAAVATTVADLHALGFCHGAIEPSHVLLDEGGRPVLCSLSRSQATATIPDADRLRADDLRALATMLLQLLPPDGSVRLIRTLRRLSDQRRRPRHDASWLARRLISIVPDAGLPAPVQPGGPAAGGEDRRAHERPPRPRIRGGLVGAGAAVGFCMLIAAGAVFADRGAVSHRSDVQVSPPATECPVVDDGCIPIPADSGVLVGPAGRYEVGQPGDVVVMGRWACSETAFPAVLRPGTGQVWTFGSWPAPDDPVVGRLVARVASAASLRVLPGRSACDQLSVDRRDLPPVTVATAGR
jgi:hypothetical protein